RSCWREACMPALNCASAASAPSAIPTAPTRKKKCAIQRPARIMARWESRKDLVIGEVGNLVIEKQEPQSAAKNLSAHLLRNLAIEGFFQPYQITNLPNYQVRRLNRVTYVVLRMCRAYEQSFIL